MNWSNLPNQLRSCKKGGKSEERRGKGKKERMERVQGGCDWCDGGSGRKLRGRN